MIWTKSIESEIFEMLEKENTKIGQKAFDVLNRCGIAGIITDGDFFWFEEWTYGNDCPQVVYDYLKRFIKRKFNLKYLWEEVAKKRAEEERRLMAGEKEIFCECGGEMTCNYIEYKKLTDKLFYGIALTDKHMNNATEQLRQYIINGSANDVVVALGIGVQTISKKIPFTEGQEKFRRFVWLNGKHKGKELSIREIENIGMFFKGGAFYGKESEVIKND